MHLTDFSMSRSVKNILVAWWDIWFGSFLFSHGYHGWLLITPSLMKIKMFRIKQKEIVSSAPMIEQNTRWCLDLILQIWFGKTTKIRSRSTSPCSSSNLGPTSFRWMSVTHGVSVSWGANQVRSRRVEPWVASGAWVILTCGFPVLSSSASAVQYSERVKCWRSQGVPARQPEP